MLNADNSFSHDPFPQSPFPEEAGVSPLPSGLHGLGQSFPEIVFLLHDAAQDRHILIEAYPADAEVLEAISEGFQSLACFRDFSAASDAVCRLGSEGHLGFEPVVATFEEARGIALKKTCGIAALMVMAPPMHPLIHYVR